MTGYPTIGAALEAGLPIFVAYTPTRPMTPAERLADYRRRANEGLIPIPHGQPGTHRNIGCTCPPYMTAHNRYRREYDQRYRAKRATMKAGQS